MTIFQIVPSRPARDAKSMRVFWLTQMIFITIWRDSQNEIITIDSSFKRKNHRNEGTARKDGWTAEDEQILTFLLELLELRLFIHSVKMKAEEKQSEIYRLHDKMQDEKNLLITE